MVELHPFMSFSAIRLSPLSNSPLELRKATRKIALDLLQTFCLQLRIPLKNISHEFHSFTSSKRICTPTRVLRTILSAAMYLQATLIMIILNELPKNTM